MPVTSPSPPFHDLAEASAAVDGNTDSARQHDEQSLDGLTLRRQHVAGIHGSNGTVRGQPLQLSAWGFADGLVIRQSIDDVSCCHGGVVP
jgi:hypothetical protein